MKFQERIGEAIKQSGYSQKHIANLLNISEGNITNWKKGENLPSVEILYKLCLILDESADFLLGLDETTPPKSPSVNYTNSMHIGNNNFR